MSDQYASWHPRITFNLPKGWGQQEWADFQQDLFLWLRDDGRGVQIETASQLQEQATIATARWNDDGSLEIIDTQPFDLWTDPAPRDPDAIP